MPLTMMRRRLLLASALLLAVACGGDDGSSDDIDSGSSASVDARINTGGDAATVDAPVAVADAGAADADPADAGPPPDAPPPQTFYWADWTAATTGASGSADGSFAPPSGAVTITYSGELAFAQTTGGTNYWVPGDPYINAVTANAPGDSDIIALTGGAGTYTLTFNPPVTGLVMAHVSLGTPWTNVKYQFDTPITLLSYGQGYWGDGVIEVEGTSTISGTEGHGATQFNGTVSSVSWTVVGNEYWHGFTVGIPNQ